MATLNLKSINTMILLLLTLLTGPFLYNNTEHHYIVFKYLFIKGIHFQIYVTKTLPLFNDNIILIQMYQNGFTACELLIYYFS